MATVTIYDVYNALGLTAENGTQTLINSIRNSTDLQGVTQVFDGTVEGLNNFGVAVNRDTRRQNIFINELVDRIGLVIINSIDLQNPLKRFKKGRMPLGSTIEETFTDLIKAQSFNPSDAEQTLYKRTPPNVRVLFHNNWRKELYPNTIERTTMQQAFTSFDKLEQFIVSIYQAQYNSNEVDEYIWTKSLIESYVANGFATYVQVPEVTDESTGKTFVKTTRATAKKMQLTQGSSKYNAAGVHTRTTPSKTWILIDADLDSTLDVEVLARAFAMSKTDIEQNKIVIENFAQKGLQAVMFDEDILKIYDKEFLMNSKENEKGLYTNTFLHVHQLYSMGKFQNLVAFMSEDIPPIRRLLLTPLASYVTLNAEKELKGYIELDPTVKLTDVDFKVQATDDNGTVLTGVTTSVTATTNNYVVKAKVTDKKLVDQNVNITVTASTKVTPPVGPEAKSKLAKAIEEPYVRTVTAIIVANPETTA